MLTRHFYISTYLHSVFLFYLTGTLFLNFPTLKSTSPLIFQLPKKYEENTTIFHLDNTHLKVDTYEDSQINKKGASLFTLDEEIFAIDRTISRLVDMQSDSYMRKLGD